MNGKRFHDWLLEDTLAFFDLHLNGEATAPVEREGALRKPLTQP